MNIENKKWNCNLSNDRICFGECLREKLRKINLEEVIEKIKVPIWYFSIACILLYIISYTLYNFKNANRFNYGWFLTLVIFSYFFSIENKKKVSKSFCLTMFLWFSIILIGYFRNLKEGNSNLTRLIDFFSSLWKMNYLQITFIIILFFFMYFVQKLEKKNLDIEDSLVLYDERKGEAEYIKEFITKSEQPILGINAEWGSGKTFLLNSVLNEVRTSKKIEILRINLVLLEIEEIYPFILKNLNIILKKNLIFSSYSKKIIESLIRSSDNRLNTSIMQFFETNIASEEIEKFKMLLARLNKNIVIVFDDLDRINNAPKIERVFSFISEFSARNVKTIILYEQNNLKKIDEIFDRNYLEKYVPLSIKLTPLSLTKILKEKIKEKKLNEKDFYFLYTLENEPFEIYGETHSQNENYKNDMKFLDDFNEMLGLSFPRRELFGITTRKVDFFLNEVYFAINKANFKIEKRIIIGYYFLKHFMDEEFYEKIKKNELIEDLFEVSFKIDDHRKISLYEIDLITNFIKKSNIILEFGSTKYLDLSGKRFVLNDKKAKNSFHKILEKIDIFDIIIEKNEVKNMREIDIKLKESIKKIKENSISKEQSINLFIRMIFNCYFYFKTDNDIEALERSESINFGIQKLNYLGGKFEGSSYRDFYLEISKILSINNIDCKIEQYKKLLDDVNHQTNNRRPVFKWGENQESKIMDIIRTLGTTKEQIDYLELNLKISGGIIKDTYLRLLLRTDILNFSYLYRKGDKEEAIIGKENQIIKAFVQNKSEIENIELFYSFIKNIDKLLPVPIYSADSFEGKALIDYIKAEVIVWKRKKSYKIIKEVKEKIDMSIKFLCIIEKIHEEVKNKPNKKNKKSPEMSVSFSEYIGYTKAKMQLNSLNSDIEKIDLVNDWVKESKFNIQEIEIIIEKIDFKD